MDFVPPLPHTGHRILSVSVHDAGASPAAGLKRQVFALALSGCDLLIGENGAGKTTRGPLAITAAVEGLATVPTDPRRPYVGGLPAETAVTLRIQSPGGVESLTRDLSIARGGSVAAADQRARDLIGIPPTAWDLRDFASGTDGDRGKILDAVARAGGALEQWDAARAQAHVRGLLTDDLDERRDPGVWTGPLDRCVAALNVAPDGATWLRAAELWAVAEQTRTNGAQKEAEAALKTIIAGRPTPPVGDAAADENLRRGLLRQGAALVTIAADVERARREAARHAAEGERLAKANADAEADGARLKTPTPAPDVTIPAEVTARVKAAEKALKAPIPPAPGAPDAEAAKTAAHEAVEAEGKAREIADEKAADRDAIRVDVEALQRQATDAAARLAALRSLSGADDVCVHCGATDPRGLAGQIAEAAEAAADAAARVDQARPLLAAADADARAASDAWTAARTLAARADATMRAALAARDAAADHEPRIRAERKTALDNARAELAREEARATGRQAAHAAAEAQREADLTAARARWTAARDALVAWQASSPPAIPVAPSDAERVRIADDLRAVESRIAARRAVEDHTARVAAAAAAYEAAKLTWDATRCLVASVRKARDDMAAAAYGPIHTAARGLLDGADTDGLPLPYFASPADYGADVPGRGCVPFAGLSESEQRITAAAIAYALATVAGCPCRLVLLDGLEVVQRDHRAALIGALARAHAAGSVDNVVMTMATSPGEDLGDVADIPGLTLHTISRDVRAVEERVVKAVAEPVVPVARVAVVDPGEAAPF